MEENKSGKVLVVILILLFWMPFSTASESVIPYVRIDTPVDGQTVTGTTTIKFVAEGYKLHDPSLSIEGENMGFAMPVACTVSEPIGGDGTQKMYCQYAWNTESFEGQKATINASVHEGNSVLNDKVGVYVSSERV
ncbi:MAG: hypothetical protein JW744_01280 [Candidatus Diapherotrites archaeon]|uniref:Uncharacterized protein n=1 Tax=Candidatus Iainarchaeum sp. TaxID=3101447 RepID=A0A938YWF9_9ARCH|nr:hypothetical protein [Candidatus Diapherotrites archaeon]